MEGYISRKGTKGMGVYLNSKKSGFIFKTMVQSPYFVDKSTMLEELIPVVESDREGSDSLRTDGRDIKYICITRPRRFGKTVMASMVASFFGKGEDSKMLLMHYGIFLIPFMNWKILAGLSLSLMNGTFFTIRILPQVGIRRLLPDF